jgi:C-terminal processing protease CtpA/Prc
MTTLVASAPLVGQEDRGYLGINVDCTNCQRKSEPGEVVWSFSTPPRVSWVREGGPAARAGFREGDFIIAVEGVDITSEEGGRLFGSMRVGVPVRFLVRRGEREADVVVEPGTASEAFGEEYAALMFVPKWDSVQVQLKMVYDGYPQLQVQLREAQRALLRTEAEAERVSSAETRRAVEIQRAQIDSMQRQLDEWQKLMRNYADSLAVRTLYVRPKPPQPAQRAGGESHTVTIYSDAVAGARFQELDAESPLVSDLEGVDGGLLIVKVVKSTPAYSAGLRQGDVVLAVNGQPVATVAELRKLLRGTAELTYVRKGQKATCTIPSKDN